MDIELVESTYWNRISSQIDEEFGEGVTHKLIRERVPVRIEDEPLNSIYLVPREWVRIIESTISGLDVYSLGLWFGDAHQDRLRLSLPILNPLAELTSNLIHVERIAAESFTYGRSIIKESVIDVDQSLKRRQRVIILNEIDEVLGLAELAVDAARIPYLKAEDLVAKNLIDIGWYIRRLG